MKQWREWNTDSPSAGARRLKQRIQRERLEISAKLAVSLSLYRARKQRAARMALGHLAYRRAVQPPVCPHCKRLLEKRRTHGKG